MGFFSNLLMNVAKGAVKGAINGDISGGVVNQVTGSNTTHNLPVGRMKKTDVIKGKNCTIPNEPTVYRFRDKETGDVMYKGQTLYGKTRMQQHARDGKLDTNKQWVEYSSNPNMTKEDLRRIEKEHIKRETPPGNTYSGGNGR